MALPATTPMLISRNIRILHLEPTDVCQARCPLCARETNPEFDPRQQHHLSVEDIQNLLPVEFISNLDKMFMCGVYGDPAAGMHSLELYRYFRGHNPRIVLGMNTNGGLRDHNWWHQLAQILCQPQDYVVFSIDGLEDTNHIYRQGVSWTRLMSNVASFIQAGGHAHWDMLVYAHNEHQVDRCEQLARDLGFKWFRAKVSKRPLVESLQYPMSWNLPKLATGPVQCRALVEQSLYIDAQARITACCWLAEQHAGVEVEQVQDSWCTTSPFGVCARNCATATGVTNFGQQWRKEIQLN